MNDQQKMKVWKCDECTEIDDTEEHFCITSGTGEKPRYCHKRYSEGINSKDNAKWQETTKFKITEIPEPVWVLDIPEELKKAINPDLWKSNGSKVEIVTPTSKEFTGIRINQRIWDVACSWLKQKPAEPTVEEELQKKIGIINKIAEAVYRDVVFTGNLPEQIKRILAGEE